MSWVHFPYLCMILFLIWMTAFYCEYKKFPKFATALYLFAILLFTLFLVLFWYNIGRPPFRTLGETRLWYGFFLPIIGLLIRHRLGLNWLNIYAIIMTVLFLSINLFKPELHDKTLMPALQSPWFVPHVVVYMIGYALLGASFLVGVKGVLTYTKEKESSVVLKERLLGIKLSTLGLLFVSLGLIFGALWAKTAWGHYWTWDPKETWALLTWLVYLFILHIEFVAVIKPRRTFWFLILAFIVLLGCWFGVNYMPSAKTSVHTYSS